MSAVLFIAQWQLAEKNVVVLNYKIHFLIFFITLISLLTILIVFALEKDHRPTEKTALFHAPFFNVYEDGHVCMGTVDINIKNSASVEEFMQAWESYFFNSYFSHLVNEHNPVKVNCVSLWKDLIGTDKAFPKDVLKKTNKTIKTIL